MHPALAGLPAYKQFIIYRLKPSESRPGKRDKLPCDYRTGRDASAHDPRYWTDYATAKATAIAFGDGWGVGFVFTEDDPFWFLDIDGCLINGQWSPLAVSLCQLFAGCAIEVSNSGTGLHIFGRGKTPAHKCTNKAMGLEFYHTARFVALTEDRAQGDCMTDASAILPAFVATYFPADEAAMDATWGDGPCEEWYGPSDDAELLLRAMKSRSTASAFGTKASFADLWLVNESVLAVNYPDPNGRSYDASAADAALAQHLAFWTGNHCERILRMMQQSGLVRDKWDREDYLPRTLQPFSLTAHSAENGCGASMTVPAGG
jgi:primase-polymerase (primpol)-like protein